MKKTDVLTPNHIVKYKSFISTRPCKRKAQKGFLESTVYSNMIRLKSYIKRLSERNYLKILKASDVPINNIMLKNPTYLTKEELKLVFEQLDKNINCIRYNRTKRDYIYADYMLRAMVHLLYAT